MTEPHWTPPDWKLPPDYGDRDSWIHIEGFKEGATAMLQALLKWLDEPCDKHLIRPVNFVDVINIETHMIDGGYYRRHRKDCPDCMKELEEK